MRRAADAIREDEAHWATVSRLSHLIHESGRQRRRRRPGPPLQPGAREGDLADTQSTPDRP